mgnify:CR=1 FL=1
MKNCLIQKLREILRKAKYGVSIFWVSKFQRSSLFVFFNLIFFRFMMKKKSDLIKKNKLASFKTIFH